jgi:hypothetical protein
MPESPDEAQVGVNCHLTLAHTGIDGGQPYGFVLAAAPRSRPEGVLIQREVFGEETAQYGSMRVWVYCNLLLADDLLNPDGTRHTASRGQMYSKLMQFLERREGITLTCPAGTLLNLGALGFTAREVHFASHATVDVQLNNVGYYWPPVDPATLELCVWDGPLSWDTGYWR